MLWNLTYLLILWVTIEASDVPKIPTDFDVSSIEEISAASDEIANRYVEEYIRYMETGVESEELIELSDQLRQIHNMDKFSRAMPLLAPAEQFFTCTTCRIGVQIALKIIRGPIVGAQSGNLAKNIFSDLCSRLNIQTQEVCTGLFNLYWPSLYYVLKNSKADPRSICGTLPTPFCPVTQEAFNWQLSIDNSVGPLMAPKAEVPQKTPDDLIILHLTDIHYDPEYREDSLAECKEPMCCRATSTGGPLTNETMAGYWGDYRSCDMPLRMIEDAFDHIRRTHQKIDYIYNTGDIVPHNVWSTTKEGNKALITEINNLIEQKFPGIPVYSSVGNHEMHPSNILGHSNLASEFRPDWLYEHLWNVWQRWLPPTAREDVLKGGYYSVSPKPGFRIISLNNNDCYLLNWWIFYDGSATSQPQLVWLHDTLLEASKAGEYVHILAHIPSGATECWTVWAREFNRIIERFSHIISGIFNGHTHTDEFEVHYSQRGHAMGISWNGGSLTTYTLKNPNYRVYEVEPSSYQVVDHATWIFNLTEANAQDRNQAINWFQEYQFTDFTTDLSPAGIDKLLVKMAENPDILRQFWKYKIVSGDPQLAMGCNNDCLLNTICNLATSVYNEKGRCKELQEKLKTTLSSQRFKWRY